MRRLEKFGTWLKKYFSNWRITRVDTAVFLLIVAVGCAFAGAEFVRDMTRKTDLVGQIHYVDAQEAIYFKGRALLNINLADKTSLMALPGIGEELAGRIIAYREANGPFSNVDELTNVSGIGEATLEAIRSRVTVKK